MRMCYVLQERLVFRAGGLLRAMRWVAAQQPGLLDSSVVQQVEALAAADDINPAVQVSSCFPTLHHQVNSNYRYSMESCRASPPTHHNTTRPYSTKLTRIFATSVESCQASPPTHHTTNRLHSN
jgi:hypothetical protein